MGLEQSRRDDLESLCYVVVYLLNGSLPWCGLSYETRQEKLVKIKYTKEQITPLELCAGLPDQVAEMLMYCKSLAFTDKPDYDKIRVLLRSCLEQNSLKEGRLGITCDEK